MEIIIDNSDVPLGRRYITTEMEPKSYVVLAWLFSVVLKKLKEKG